MNKKVIRKTPFSPVVIIWAGTDNAAKIIRLLLSKPGLSAEKLASELYPNSEESSCAAIDSVAKTIKVFLNGKNVTFSLDTVDWKQCSFFQRAVLSEQCRIPRGRVRTYQQLAERLAKKRGTRAVGNALAKNPFPIMIPCHRAVCSDRSPGGFQGGAAMKCSLLMKEGVKLDETGKVIGIALGRRNG